MGCEFDEVFIEGAHGSTGAEPGVRSLRRWRRVTPAPEPRASARHGGDRDGRAPDGARCVADGSIYGAGCPPRRAGGIRLSLSSFSMKEDL